VNKQTRVVFILLASLLFAACESDNSALESVEPALEKLKNNLFNRSPQPLIDAGATRLTSEQARAHVSGNTEFWDQGSVYYNPDGQLDLVWNKVNSTGSWEISGDGNVCFTVPKWNKNCHYYLQHDGAIVTVNEGSTNGVLKVEPGKHLLRY
jgi:hypothetical protein